MSTLVDLRCASCSNYLLEGPIQCSCGDRLCNLCFKELSSKEPSFTCSKCESIVLVKDCFKDRAASREIRNATLTCSHQNCTWKGPAESYLGHIKNCELKMDHALHTKYGHLDDNKYWKISTSKDKWKPRKCHPSDSGVSHAEVMSLEKMSLFQGKECEFKSSGSKGKFGGSDTSDIQCSWFLNETGSLKKEVESKYLAVVQQISDLKSEINHLHREISVKMQPVVSAVSEAETAIQGLQEGFSELALMVQTVQATTFNGKFIWKIPEVQRRRHEAKIGKTISLYSAPFYTSRQGYKACLRLYMDGDGCGKNTHLSYFLTIMKGEYDALLEWPFRHTVTLTLLDQSGSKNIAQSFKPEPTSLSFHRPKKEMNIASGCPMFAPLSVLNNSSYVKDDNLFLKCEIDTTGIKLP